ncbi:S-adenosyl-L-methionine-dependent methyltransferase [Cercophora newfieldiana]|uniref:S-adenosyl-L-methionine-dependent methyltransferase n=1 Tax=Cercophora newfieldiana TaxID=92897 RepID=A0AA39Y1T2_9PEZI|nr:S-adenosyl-L-methionine-dependent methyltransferase [Cercophora newfieldiana]
MSQSPKPDQGSNEQAAPITVDPSYLPRDAPDNDNDSLLSTTTTATSTQSITSSVLRFREIHGRTYQNYEGAEYWQPNDDKQNDGLDLQHHMMLLLAGNKLFRAPLEDPQSVLDVGTGTGIWAVDFAEQFPGATVIGTDLSPIQPPWVPPNCSFELDDATREWTYADGKFDFVHIRYLTGSIPDWKKVYEQAYRCLKPGGWIEHTDFTIEGTTYDWWTKFFVDAGEKIGRTFLVTKDNQNVGWLKDSGFTGPIHVKNHKMPIGTWPADETLKEVGAFNLVACEQGLEGFAVLLGTQILGYSYEELQVIFADMRKCLRNKAYHAYYPASTTWTQKPLD